MGSYPASVCENDIKNNREYLVDSIGSEAVYKRVDQKLKNLEIDPFFYREQVLIFNVRAYYLLHDMQLRNFYVYGAMTEPPKPPTDQMLQFFSMITQNYDNTLKKVFRNKYMNFDLNLDLDNDQNNYQENGKKAWLYFLAPLKIVCMLKNHLELSHENSICKYCGRSVEHTEFEKKWLHHFIKKYPELASHARLMIQSNALYYEDPMQSNAVVYLKSLKELSIRQVLVLGLDQDSLPLSLKQQMTRGPEPRSLNAKEERVVEQLKELVKEI